MPDFSEPVIVLVRPQLGENIGAVARAMGNFGLSSLRLVAPRDGWPNEKAVASASGADFILDRVEIFATTREALHDAHVVYATTARGRDQTKPVLTPLEAMPKIAAMRQTGQRAALLFGPERTGLENDDVSLADALLAIPVDPKFSSLNISQAAVVLFYQWFLALHGDVPPFNETALKPASRAELYAFFDYFEGELGRVNFFRPPHKSEVMKRNMRNILHRLELNDQDLKTLFGAVRALVRGPVPMSGPLDCKQPPLQEG